MCRGIGWSSKLPSLCGRNSEISYKRLLRWTQGVAQNQQKVSLCCYQRQR
ncbi:hypothetical protein LINPERPRIM_LOCUS262 [Linum perenne]